MTTLSTTRLPAMEYRRFGQTNERLSVITLGGMRFKHGWDPPRSYLPKDSIDNAVETLEWATRVGINHIETAWGYMKSEHLFGVALRELGLPRESLKIMTKGAPMTGEETRKLVENQLEALQLDYVDFYGWHGINNTERLTTAVATGGPVETLHKLREEGLIRHIGFSTHAPVEIILDTLNTGLFSFMNLHFYYFFQRNRPAVELAGQKDIGVFIISPNEKGGMLWKPSDKLKSLCEPLSAIEFNGRFCLSHPEVHTLSMGMHEPEHFMQNLNILSGGPYLAPEESAILDRMDQQMSEVPGLCTLCNECLPCPEDINIPEVLRFRNLLEGFDMEDYARFRYNMLGGKGHWFPGTFASRCTECGDCLPRCPEKLEIPKLLAETHSRAFNRIAWIKTQAFDFCGKIYKTIKKFLPFVKI